MQSKVYWIPGPWPGKLGILPRPRGGDWLEDETKAWREAGIDLVVSLLERSEETQLGLEGEAAAAANSGIEFKSFPVPDRGLPASRESAAQLASAIVHALDAGKNVAVHCRQGIGRSALITGAVLITSQKKAKSALQAIGAARGLEVPETQEQRRWLEEFASWLPATLAAQPGAEAGRVRRGG